MRRRLTRLVPILIGIVALAALYGQLILPGRALAERDIPGLHLPMLADLARLGAEGMPYWNPGIHGGQPLLSNPHYAAFYPPTWLIFLVPADYSIGLLVFLHAVLAFTGAWRLARRWGCDPPAAGMAALAFVGGGAFVSSPNMLNLFMGLAWLPWVLGWGEEALRQPARGQWITAGIKTTLGIAAQILVGSPIMPLLSLLALACMALESAPDRWRRAMRLVPIACSALAISAIQLLPTLRHVADSTRGSGLHERIATTWSTPPVRLAELFWPRIYGDPMLADSMFYFGYPGVERPVPLILYIYCGAIIIALAIGGLLDKTLPHRRTLIAMTLLGVFLSLGRYNPLYTSVLIKIPPLSVIRFPEKFFLLPATAIVFAAALAWQGILSAGEQDRNAKLKVPTLVACVVLLLTAVLYITPLVAPDLAVQLLEGTSAEKVEWYEPLEGGAKLPAKVLAARAGYLGRETFITGIFWLGALALLRLHTRTRIPTIWLVGLVLGLLTVELTYYSSGVNNTVPSDLIRQPPKTLENLPPSTGRVFSDAILFRDRDFFVPSPDTEVPPSLQRFLLRVDPYSANLWGYSYALEPDPDMMLSRWGAHALDTFKNDSTLFTHGWSEKALKYLGAWNVGIVVRRRSPEAQMEEKERTGSMPAPARLLQNPWILDRFRFVTRVAYEPDIATAVVRVNDRDFDLRDFDAVVDPANRTPGTRREFDSEAQLIAVEDRASQITFDYQAATEAFLVVADTADRDWTARVNETALPVFVTALGQMGIEVPAGRNRLVLEHSNPAVTWGALISLLALVGCATLSLTRKTRHGD